ncbi:MAG: alpha/beta fold hydrolase [Phycisphaerae bacterium]
MSTDASSLGELYPFASHFLDVGGHRLHYVDEGEGDAVLMVHGNPTWSFYFRELIKALRGHHRVIASDHIGCGLSDKPLHYPYTLATHIENLEKLVDHLGLSRVSLVVHDWGGAIGFGWATRHPALFRRIVVLNTAAFLGFPIPWRIRVCGWPVIGEVLVRGFNGFAKPAITMACRKKEGMPPEVRKGYLLPYDSYANRIALLRFVRDIPQSRGDPSFDVLKSIEAGLTHIADRPMLICWGGRDFCFNDAFLQEWTRRFPGADVHRFADAGHYVLEDAGERIIPLVRRFLAQSDSAES